MYFFYKPMTFLYLFFSCSLFMPNGKDINTFMSHLENNSVSRKVMFNNEQIFLQSQASCQDPPLSLFSKEHSRFPISDQQFFQ